MQWDSDIYEEFKVWGVLKDETVRGESTQKQRAVHQPFGQREIPGDGQDVNSNMELVIPCTLTKINQTVYKTSGPHKEENSQWSIWLTTKKKTL